MYNCWLKRVLDFTLALLLLILLAPALLMIALAVRIKLGAPVLFRQRRPGLGGELFELLKFRSMSNERSVNGALLPDRERLSRFGCFLRRSSVDELPELLNIIRGEMSFIGPRPLLPKYLPYYTEAEKARHSVRPGLTGLAQVHGRNSLGWDKRLALDVEYAQHPSLTLDLWIAWKTLRLLMSGTGVEPDEGVLPLDMERERERKRDSPGKIQ
jgi:lipopolysaccharide/colanic/teichoic acid biosynthesis glycosyltransferase